MNLYIDIKVKLLTRYQCFRRMKSLLVLLLLLTWSCSEKQIYESQTTAASVAPAASVPVSAGVYQPYTGTYKMQQASFDEVAVTAEDGKLFVQATGEKKVEIYPEEEHTFTIPAFNAKITFVPAADSTFSAITVLLQGNQLKGTRKE